MDRLEPPDAPCRCAPVHLMDTRSVRRARASRTHRLTEQASRRSGRSALWITLFFLSLAFLAPKPVAAQTEEVSTVTADLCTRILSGTLDCGSRTDRFEEVGGTAIVWVRVELGAHLYKIHDVRVEAHAPDGSLVTSKEDNVPNPREQGYESWKKYIFAFKMPLDLEDISRFASEAEWEIRILVDGRLRARRKFRVTLTTPIAEDPPAVGDFSLCVETRSDQPPPTTRCSHATVSFRLDEVESVCASIRLEGPFAQEHEVTWKWYGPSGALARSSASIVPRAASHGRQQWESYVLNDCMDREAVGQAAAGEWRIQVHFDGQSMQERAFEVIAPSVPDADMASVGGEEDTPLLASSSGGLTLRVLQDGSGDFESIQEAMRAAEPGDTVRVGPGVYEEHVELASGTTLEGAGPNKTIIRCGIDEVVSAFWLDNPVKVQGLTIEYTGSEGASCLEVTHSGIEIQNVQATGATYFGVGFQNAQGAVVASVIHSNKGGVSIGYDSTVTIEGSIISNNDRNGISLYEADECQISNNWIFFNGYDGIRASGRSVATIKNNTIALNENSGVWTFEESMLTLLENIIALNGYWGVSTWKGGPNSTVVLQNNNLWENRNGNYQGVPEPGATDISEDPQFMNPEEGDFRLKPTSPCLSADQGGTPIVSQRPEGSEAVTEHVLKVVLDGSGDFTSIQAAIEEASEGTIIEIGPGTYEETIDMKNGVTLRGAGPDVSRLNWNAKTSAIHAYQVDSCIVEGLTVSGARTHLVSVRASEISFKDCVFTESTGSGLYVIEGSTINATRCEAMGNESSGVAAKDSKMTLLECRVYSNSSSGVDVRNSSVEIENTDINGNKQSGVYLEDSSAAVCRSAISENGWSGLRIRHSSFEIIGNIVSENGDHGAHIFEASTGTLHQNTLVRNGDYGIVTVEASDPLITSNVIAFNQYGGINVDYGGVPVGHPTLNHNNVWENGREDYIGIEPSESDISVNPEFVNPEEGDFRLRPTSPCLVSDVPPGWLGALPPIELVDASPSETLGDEDVPFITPSDSVAKEEEPSVPVEIPDANLALAIAAALGKQSTAAFTQSDLTELIELRCFFSGIIDLIGLEHAVNLEYLDLWSNEIVNIRVLSSLASLSYLDLGDNQITDLTPLADNPGLGEGDYVDLTGNPLDLSPGSAAMAVIQSLLDRGVEVSY